MILHVTCYYFPVDPNPPSPRSVVPRSSTELTSVTWMRRRSGAHI